jgi:hypothetical protein
MSLFNLHEPQLQQMRVISTLESTPSNLPKGKAKFICQQTDKINQEPENCENRNGPNMEQAFPKNWRVESDFTAPNLPFPLRYFLNFISI